MLEFRRLPSPYPPHANPERVRHIFWQGVRIGQILNLRPRPEAPAGDWWWSMPLGLLIMLEPYRQTGRSPHLEEAIADARAAWDIIQPILGEDNWWWLVGEAVERALTVEYPRLIIDADMIERFEERRRTHGTLAKAPATIGSELDKLMEEIGSETPDEPIPR
ncbi:MAG: hypothetical protein EOO77_15070 [Oxalobacteraceae bacterium]|nr:MAG: hypothetical protein EOO77_15070 [Oxalobacteraceae bacterium]